MGGSGSGSPDMAAMMAMMGGSGSGSPDMAAMMAMMGGSGSGSPDMAAMMAMMGGPAAAMVTGMMAGGGPDMAAMQRTSAQRLVLPTCAAKNDGKKCDSPELLSTLVDLKSLSCADASGFECCIAEAMAGTPDGPDLDDLKQRCPGFIVSRCKPIKVAMKLRMPGSVSDYTPAKIDAIKADLASSAGVDASEITIDVQAGSVIVIATMPNSAAASVAVQIQSGTLRQLGGVAVPADSFEGSSSTDATAAAETIRTVAPSVAPSAVAIPKPVIAATPAPDFEARFKTFDTCFGSSLPSSAAPCPQACKCLTDAKADAQFWPVVVNKLKAQAGAATTDILDTVVKACQAGILSNTRTTNGAVGAAGTPISIASLCTLVLATLSFGWQR